MGAVDIYFILDGSKTKKDIQAAIAEKVEEGRSYNGHHEGYSGDWQTIDSINYTSLGFNSFDEAFDFCSANCGKRDGMVVKFGSANLEKLNTNKEYKKAMETIKESHKKIDTEIKKFSELEADLAKEIKGAKSKTISCKKCESSLNRKYLEGHWCPLCKEDLFSDTNKTRLQKASAKIQNLKLDHNELVTKAEDIKKRVSAESSVMKWLVFGVAAE